MRRTDERIRADQRKATSGGFAILSWGLTAALIYRVFVLGQGLSDLPDIFALWLAANAYVTLSMTLRGVQPFLGFPYYLWPVPGIIAVTVAAVICFRQQDLSPLMFIQSFAIAFGGAFAVMMVLQGLYRWWERRNLVE
jgi:hypothetical protein